ncbi:diacylglycerol/lipid kinase family protein [Isoptericola halotolerans]|uniref:Diacylglycerol kinase family enzyme n=1 Tax=Isoptericola halotolerans TaxID=300560 RepID=A0ABX2A696_9MICO|nr:diacylglycerol kinase family protein [Isoptericola halotolerans]NOV98380.1 diacylglycerol kinase family enzyme [Isoptericola halotolerans]
MPWELTVGIAALVVGVVALVVALVAVRRNRRRTAATPAAGRRAATSPTGPRIAVVVNPSKENTDRIVDVARRVCTEAALPEPRFYETTVDDPGTGQARAAVSEGADIVVAAGGDGTVRAVAEALAGTDTPMGIIPAGTGNLLARNLDIPLADVGEAMAVVIGGRDRRIDVGRARITPVPGDGTPDDAAADPALPRGASRDDDAPGPAHLFLVIAGLGFDAAMVADTDDQLKARMGWVAYFLAGARHLHGRRMKAQIALDDETPVTARLRTFLVGNCGRLPGGITLLPDAVMDDGILDVAAIDTRGGLAGWAQLFGEVVAQGMGVQNEAKIKIGRIDHVRAVRVRIDVDGGEQAQVDGDVLGKASSLESWVEPGALVVRAPA